MRKESARRFLVSVGTYFADRNPTAAPVPAEAERCEKAQGRKKGKESEPATPWGKDTNARIMHRHHGRVAMTGEREKFLGFLQRPASSGKCAQRHSCIGQPARRTLPPVRDERLEKIEDRQYF